MTQLRYYQSEAIDGLFDFWSQKDGNPLIVLPTGTGKSIVLAEICKTCLEWPETRIIMLTHVRELVEQNYSELIRLWPQAPAGINSAGLGRRDYREPITFASIQSVWRHAERFQKIDLVIVDEAHMIPRDATTTYQRFLKDLWVINPHMKVVGLTATPFRLDSGRLDMGEGAMFDGIAYDYSIKTAIADGYLVPLVTMHTAAQLDLTGVRTQGGEFKQGDLELAIDKAELNARIVDETIARSAGRKSWLFFCAGVDHARHIRDLVRERGVSCETIHAETPKDERRKIITDFKAGKITALASMNVLTTGFNAPAVDLIAMIRPTKSAGLYIQMAGRGTRLSPGKTDCLVLDFAGNIARHGPIDTIDVGAKEKGEGEAPVKVCPGCQAYVLAAARECPNCGHVFPEPQPKYVATPAQAPILSSQQRLPPPEWVKVIDFHASHHAKPGKLPSMRVDYRTKLQTYPAWICFEHEGFAREKAVKWWKQNGGSLPIPRTVADGLARLDELTVPAEILVRPRGEFWDIVGQRGVLDLRPSGEGIPF